MIINQQDLLDAAPIENMLTEKVSYLGCSHGLTECGYDIRIKQGTWMFFGRRFVKASTVERFQMPQNLMGKIMNKSTWARFKIDASRTTNIEPGWRGWLTLELTYSGILPIYIPAGVGIAQVMFEEVRNHAQYVGKYQDQEDRPVAARLLSGNRKLSQWEFVLIGLRDLRNMLRTALSA